MSTNSNRALVVVLAAAFAACGILSAGEVRTWTDKTGAFQVQAELIECRGDRAVLKKASGETIEVPLAKLSDVDRTIAEAARGGQKPAVAGKGAARVYRTAEELAKGVNQCRKAEDAVREIEQFLARPDLPAADKCTAERLLAVWKDRVARGLVRCGAEWLEFKQAAAKRTEAAAMIEEALTLFAEGRGDQCRKKLSEASDLDRDSVAPHYLLGLGYALTARDWKKAEGQFEACLQRDPKHIGSLNNAALAQVRLGKYPEALANWSRVLEEGPAPAEVAHNLQRLSANAERILPPMPKSAKQRAMEMAAKLSGEPAPEPSPGAPPSRTRAKSAPAPRLPRVGRGGDENGWQYVALVRRELRPPTEQIAIDDEEAVALAGRDGPIAMLDRWCLVCGGLGHVKCPVMACSAGKVPTARVERKVVDARMGTTAPARIVERQTCPTCKGKSRVPCTHCSDGLER